MRCTYVPTVQKDASAIGLTGIGGELDTDVLVAALIVADRALTLKAPQSVTGEPVPQIDLSVSAGLPDMCVVGTDANHRGKSCETSDYIHTAALRSRNLTRCDEICLREILAFEQERFARGLCEVI